MILCITSKKKIISLCFIFIIIFINFYIYINTTIYNIWFAISILPHRCVSCVLTRKELSTIILTIARTTPCYNIQPICKERIIYNYIWFVGQKEEVQYDHIHNLINKFFTYVFVLYLNFFFLGWKILYLKVDTLVLKLIQ